MHTICCQPATAEFFYGLVLTQSPFVVQSAEAPPDMRIGISKLPVAAFVDLNVTLLTKRQSQLSLHTFIGTRRADLNEKRAA